MGLGLYFLAQTRLEKYGYVYIPGKSMRSLMKSFGATEEDLARLESGNIHKDVPLDQQPVMKHRRTAIHRMLMDQANNKIESADTHACSVFLMKEIASNMEEGSKMRGHSLSFVGKKNPKNARLHQDASRGASWGRSFSEFIQTDCSEN